MRIFSVDGRNANGGKKAQKNLHEAKIIEELNNGEFRPVQIWSRVSRLARDEEELTPDTGDNIGPSLEQFLCTVHTIFPIPRNPSLAAVTAQFCLPHTVRRQREI